MVEQTASEILVAADPAQVMAAIADFAAYPQWATGVKQTEVVEPGPGPGERARRVRFVLDAPPIRDEYVLRYQWDGDRAVSWTLDRGTILRGLDGAYVLEPEPAGGTRVTYRLSVDVAIPLIGMLKRKAERVIIEAALRGLKQRVESGSA